MSHVTSIPIDRIRVVNPRRRNPRLQREQTESIRTVGLKRPITVAPRKRPDGSYDYDLVCGQGRLEAFIALGQHDIPAHLVDVSESECLLRSLVENIARRQHTPIELMKRIEELHGRDYSDLQIAEKIGTSKEWVSAVLGLMKHGEDRLVAAVETETLPISLAVVIARSSDAEAQEALAEAYREGKLKGKKLLVVRRLLEARQRLGKTNKLSPMGRHTPHRKLTPDQLVKMYREQTQKHQILIKKAEVAQSKLLFVSQAMKELFHEPAYVHLLREEGLMDLPQGLDPRGSAAARA